jgi:hypothetical protein
MAEVAVAIGMVASGWRLCWQRCLKPLVGLGGGGQWADVESFAQH